MVKTENSEIPTMSHDVPMVSLQILYDSCRCYYDATTSRIITVLLRPTPVHHDGATVLLRIMPMYPDLTNRASRSSAVAQNRECVKPQLHIPDSGYDSSRFVPMRPML